MTTTQHIPNGDAARIKILNDRYTYEATIKEIFFEYLNSKAFRRLDKAARKRVVKSMRRCVIHLWANVCIPDVSPV